MFRLILVIECVGTEILFDCEEHSVDELLCWIWDVARHTNDTAVIGRVTYLGQRRDFV